MDLKTMFPNLTVMWTRWSDYHVISQYGMHFLVPYTGCDISDL